MEHFGAIVIGGGPAGAASALALARGGVAVLLVERTHYERWRPGETLPPAIERVLTELGVWERFLALAPLASYGICSAWGSAKLHENSFIFDVFGNGWHIGRARFDAMLAQAAEAAGARVLMGSRVETIASHEGGWKVGIAGNNACEVSAPMLVDASGRTARFARHAGAVHRTSDRLVGIVGIVPHEQMREVSPTLLVESSQEGWWYSAPVPNAAMAVAFMTDGDLLGASGLPPAVYWQVRLGRTVHTAQRVAGMCMPTEVRVEPAMTSRLERATGPGWMACGEAAVAFDPLSAGGVAHALESGLRCGQAAAKYLEGDSAAPGDYADVLAERFATYLEQRASFYRMEKRWPESPFWRRRCSLVPVPQAAAPARPRLYLRNV